MRKGEGGLWERLAWMVTRACGWRVGRGWKRGGVGWWWCLRMARDVGWCLTVIQ